MVNAGAPWGSFGSFGVVGFTHEGRRVYSGSLGSLVCALRVDGFIWGRWVHSGSRWVHAGAPLKVVGFTRVRTGCGGVYSGSLGSLTFIRGRSVHSGNLLGSSGLFRVFGFIRVRPRGTRTNACEPESTQRPSWRTLTHPTTMNENDEPQGVPS